MKKNANWNTEKENMTYICTFGAKVCILNKQYMTPDWCLSSAWVTNRFSWFY